MKVKKLILLLSIVLFCGSCSHNRITQKTDASNTSQEVSVPKPVKSNVVSKNNQGMLLGKIEIANLMNELPIFKSKKETYQPEPDAVSVIKNYDQDVHVIVFLGTWCGDSKRNVPAFIKLLESAQNQHFTAEYWGLDRTKSDELGMTKTYAIKRVPTFIFIENGTEFGRITENPGVSMEDDIAEILENRL